MEHKSYHRERLQATPKMWMRRILRVVCLLLAVALVPAVLVLRMRADATVEFMGLVESGAENVGPVESSRIVSIEVAAGQRVKAGDVLVRLDPSERLLSESIDDIRISEFEQSLAKRRETVAESERQCRRLVHEAEVKLEESKMQRVRDQAELSGLEAEMARLKPLVEKRMVSELELSSLRPKADSLKGTVSQYGPLIAALERRLAAAKKDLDEIVAQRRQSEEEIAGAMKAVRHAAQRSDNLRKADPTTLKALADGIVSRVFRHPGDIVAGGDPVVRMTAADGAVFITGMLPVTLLDAVHEGDEFRVTRNVVTRAATEEIIRGKVETIESEVLDLFDPSNPAPRTPVRGRKVRIRVLEGAATLVPGEAVTLSDATPGFFQHLLARGARAIQ